MKPREITILTSLGADAEDKIRKFLDIPDDGKILRAIQNKRLAYAIERHGVRYEYADEYFISGVKLDSAHIKMLMYILDHSRWCVRYLIVQTDRRR